MRGKETRRAEYVLVIAAWVALLVVEVVMYFFTMMLREKGSVAVSYDGVTVIAAGMLFGYSFIMYITMMRGRLRFFQQLGWHVIGVVLALGVAAYLYAVTAWVGQSLDTRSVDALLFLAPFGSTVWFWIVAWNVRAKMVRSYLESS
jgi:hypothetical protein